MLLQYSAYSNDNIRAGHFYTIPHIQQSSKIYPICKRKNTLNVQEMCTLFIVIKLAHNLVNLLSDLSYSGFLLLLVSYFMFTLPHSFDNRDKEK